MPNVRIVPLLAILAVAGSAIPGVLAQNTPAEVTDAQIATYQRNIENGCRNSARRNGRADREVAAFCGCMSKTFRDGLTHSQWQQAYLYAMQGENDRERAVFAASMRKLETCKANEGRR